MIRCWIRIETYANGATYEGEVHKGQRDGVGCFYGKGFPDAYCGEWLNASRHGRGFAGVCEVARDMVSLHPLCLCVGGIVCLRLAAEASYSIRDTRGDLHV